MRTILKKSKRRIAGNMYARHYVYLPYGYACKRGRCGYAVF